MQREMFLSRIIIVSLMLVVAIALTGCGDKEPEEEFEDPGTLYLVDLCYVNSEYANTGDEDLPKFYYYELQNMFADEGQQYLTLLDSALRDDLLGIESFYTMITDKIQFNSVEVEDGTAYVDMKGEGLTGGSLDEGLLISQIVNSLVGSFDEIKRVQFLIDGEIQDTLMGHYDVSTPFEIGIFPPK